MTPTLGVPAVNVLAEPRATWRDHLAGLLMCVVYVAVLLATANDLAMARDESFYVDAAQSYAGWFEQLGSDRAAALTPEAITRGWSYNHEHPALMKALFAFSWMAQQKWHVFPNDSLAFRFPGMVTAGLLLWLVYVFGVRTFGRAAGAFAAASLALMPRVFYHAHLDCFDVPIVFFLTLVTYCYWRSLTLSRFRALWVVATGVSYGLALATKHNAWLLPGVLVIHWVWAALGEVRARRRGGVREVSLVPWWLLAILTLGPLVFYASWPWIWHETLPRLREYAAFHLHHDYYNMEYFGRNYFWPPFPVSYPFVMTAFTVPVTTLVLALGALLRRTRAFLPASLAERALPQFLHATGVIRADRRATDVLFLGALLQPMLVIALPSTPIFGGTKHWFAAYPFLALFAGVGFVYVTRGFRQLVGQRIPSPRVVVRTLAALVLLAPSLAETAHSHPFALSHYGMLAGGVPGAATLGMNRQFWGFTTGSLVPWFKQQMPEGGTVWLCDTTWGAWRMLQRDGLLPENLRAAGDLAHADYALVHHEKHFAEVDFQIWVAFGTSTPATVLTYDGVPIVTVYENPAHARRRLARRAR